VKINSVSLIVLSLLVLTHSHSAAASDKDRGVWLGGLVGQQSFKTTSSTSVFSYGGAIGYRFGTLGVQGQYVTGSKTQGRIKVTSTIVGGQLDIFLAGKIFYIGPRVDFVTVSALGFSSSGAAFGGGGGLNIPLGKISIGGDASWAAGTINNVSFTDMTYMGSIKYWFN